MNKEQTSRATEFAVFCIENTADRLGTTGTDVWRDLNRTDGIAKFLYPSYAMLHTQSKDYIVDEVLRYMASQRSQLIAREGGES